MRYSISVLLFLLLIITSGCDVNVTGVNDVPTAAFVTATLPPTAIPLPTQTSLPPTIAPTIAPIEGTTTTQINVRAETSTASENLGAIAQFSKVQIIGRDASTSWYKIVYTQAAEGSGWIRAEYVQINAAAEIPVIEVVTGSGAAVSGLVIQKINVRSGPGTSYELLGELNPNDVVFISGVDESGKWMQIEFSNSADRKGWASLEFLKVEDTSSLPVIGTAGKPAATSAANEETAPAAIPLAAMQDGDSMQSPLANISFSVLGTSAAQINGEVSTPNGDAEDWIEFTAYNERIAIQLLCLEKALQVELWANGEMVDNFPLACKENHLLSITAEQTYLLRLSAPSDEFHYTKYMLIMTSLK